MDKLFKLKENGTDVRTEVLAGLTTFFAMSYILFVNPQILSQTGMPASGRLPSDDYWCSSGYLDDGFLC
ncbi:xanthine/uracil permease family protein [Streptococcus pneumoniae]|nr:xanthine/uracil permease family protein [Streptococcus pneumoniae]